VKQSDDRSLHEFSKMLICVDLCFDQDQDAAPSCSQRLGIPEFRLEFRSAVVKHACVPCGLKGSPASMPNALWRQLRRFRSFARPRLQTASRWQPWSRSPLIGSTSGVDVALGRIDEAHPEVSSRVRPTLDRNFVTIFVTRTGEIDRTRLLRALQSARALAHEVLGAIAVLLGEAQRGLSFFN
jgi:hypothetical protein